MHSFSVRDEELFTQQTVGEDFQRIPKKGMHMCLIQRRGEADKKRIFVNFMDRDAQGIHYLYEEVGRKRGGRGRKTKAWNQREILPMDKNLWYIHMYVSNRATFKAGESIPWEISYLKHTSKCYQDNYKFHLESMCNTLVSPFLSPRYCAHLQKRFMNRIELITIHNYLHLNAERVRRNVPQ